MGAIGLPRKASRPWGAPTGQVFLERVYTRALAGAHLGATFVAAAAELSRPSAFLRGFRRHSAQAGSGAP